MILDKQHKILGPHQPELAVMDHEVDYCCAKLVKNFELCAHFDFPCMRTRRGFTYRDWADKSHIL